MKAIKENIFIILLILASMTGATSAVLSILPEMLAKYGIIPPLEYYLFTLVTLCITAVTFIPYIIVGIRGHSTPSKTRKQ